METKIIITLNKKGKISVKSENATPHMVMGILRDVEKTIWMGIKKGHTPGISLEDKTKDEYNPYDLTGLKIGDKIKNIGSTSKYLTINKEYKIIDVWHRTDKTIVIIKNDAGKRHIVKNSTNIFVRVD